MGNEVNPRKCIEEAILQYDPAITAKKLLDKRENIYLKVLTRTNKGGVIEYHRDNFLYTIKEDI